MIISCLALSALHILRPLIFYVSLWEQDPFQSSTLSIFRYVKLDVGHVNLNAAPSEWANEIPVQILKRKNDNSNIFLN